MKKKIAALVTAAMMLFTPQAIAVENGYVPPIDSVANSVAYVDSDLGNCSGTFISPSWVLTAQHCVPNGGTAQVEAGINRDGGTYTAQVHLPKNNNPAGKGDVALLNIDGVHDGAIAHLPTSPTATPANGNIAGFGPRLSSARYSEQYIFETRSNPGSNIYNPVTNYRSFNNAFSQGNVTFGDSGGPLFVGNEIVGVARGMEEYNNANIQSSSVYENLPWINDVTGYRLVQPGSTGSGYQFQTPYQSPVVTDNGPHVAQPAPQPQPSGSSLSSLSSF